MKISKTVLAVLSSTALLTGCGNPPAQSQAEHTAAESSAETTEKTEVTDTAASSAAATDTPSAAEKTAADGTASHDYEEGYADGYADGYNASPIQYAEDGVFDRGYAKGYEVGFESGKQYAEPGQNAAARAVSVSGDFTATVRKLIPDYVAEPGNTAAVVTLFQDGPFVLKLNADICGQLKEEETYTFLIEEEETELSAEMLREDGCISENALILRQIRVKGVRAPEEHEYGLNCWRVKWTAAAAG